MKTCSKCKAVKAPSEFYSRSDTGKPRSVCKVCFWVVPALKVLPPTKTCYKCEISKSRSEFHKRRASADRLAPVCKTCWATPALKEFSLTKTCFVCQISKSRSEFSGYLASKDGLQRYCKVCTRVYDKNRIRNRAKEASRRRERYALQSEEAREGKRIAFRNWRQRNPGYVAPCELANPAYFSEWKAFKYKTDPNFKVTKLLRTRQWEEIKRSKAEKSSSTLTLTGCSAPELWDYLGSLFKPGMTIKNHGPVWEIDHIKPCAAFDLRDPEQQKACFHWTNLQPLFVEENRKKGAKYNG